MLLFPSAYSYTLFGLNPDTPLSLTFIVTSILFTFVAVLVLISIFGASLSMLFTFTVLVTSFPASSFPLTYIYPFFPTVNPFDFVSFASFIAACILSPYPAFSFFC